MIASYGKGNTSIHWSREFLRPWKLGSLAVGIALLLIGSVVMPAPDWDVGVSFTMAILTYLTAPWFIHVIRRLNWKMIPLALFFAWFSIDGCYWLLLAVLVHGQSRSLVHASGQRVCLILPLPADGHGLDVPRVTKESSERHSRGFTIIEIHVG
ncbi:hypothetical protein [Halothiobacillus diazotrophicus]|uniref:hypothetical protein n=1 Tax=Halothiobacillus diazotrophicus TaxID=1860122 RepID=UPI001E50828E|nr:hypothetical protein [Halothiobacillus diazotrophicus]